MKINSYNVFTKLDKDPVIVPDRFSLSGGALPFAFFVFHKQWAEAVISFIAMFILLGVVSNLGLDSLTKTIALGGLFVISGLLTPIYMKYKMLKKGYEMTKDVESPSLLVALSYHNSLSKH